MAARHASGESDGSSPVPVDATPSSSVPRRRYSMEEDMFYQQIMSTSPRRSSRPPPYESSTSKSPWQRTEETGRLRADSEPESRTFHTDDIEDDEESECLPRYRSSVSIEGVFSKKHEIENTIKRAEDRRWHPVFVSLNGTALNVYHIKRDWGWGKGKDGPTISPDNPPWVKVGKLEKSYNLLHADAGIAADYDKRRYVIRVRAEEDQFLLSCVELSTFVKWLDSLFAAIDVAAPIDDRDFPRDMSIPRVQRIRWYRGQSPSRQDETSHTESEAQGDSAVNSEEVASSEQMTHHRLESLSRQISPTSLREPRSEGDLVRTLEANSEEAVASDDEEGVPPPRVDLVHRLSTTSYTNVAINPHTGKWFPEHKWSSAHDLLYAKLCYSNLLFRSPRKSNYIISRGKQWFVDWGTGKMVRVLPPTYAEIDYFGPWHLIHTENRRI